MSAIATKLFVWGYHPIAKDIPRVKLAIDGINLLVEPVEPIGSSHGQLTFRSKAPDHQIGKIPSFTKEGIFVYV